ncbi:MAG TPA: hypothetical protein VHT97_13345 [Acidimicrobiales bacterium]|jgi:hypothetical protein|nr:hypothetical protein [Acidimicrobiales bacterium]
MKLQTAMIADAARVAENKLYVFGGQWDRIYAHSFPAAHTGLTIVLVIEVDYSEALTDHHLRVVLMRDGEAMGAEARALINVGHAPGSTPGAPSYVPIALPFEAIAFSKAGRYEWAVTINDEPMGSIPLEVALAPGGAVEEPAQPFQG